MTFSPRTLTRALLSRSRSALRLPTRPWLERRPAQELAVSVVIPVKNAGADLPPLLARLGEQRGFRRVELVVVDSGSSDGSLDAARAAGAALLCIPPEQFSHSYARNLGAQRASGDYLLFTVQDALPPSEHWLLELFCALQRHAAAAVSCGEDPRADCDLFYRAISWGHLQFMSAAGGDRVMSREGASGPLERRRNAQLSDTACLISRALFLRYRHRGEFAEDLDLGLRLIDARYRLAFVASPRIIHSHNRPAWYHLRRSYVEHLALYGMLSGYPMVPGDAAQIARDILHSCAALDAAVRADWSSSAGPQQLRDAVTAVLCAAPSAGLCAAPSAGLCAAPSAVGGAPGADYLDAPTRAFVSRVQQRFAPAAHGADAPAGALVQAVAGIAATLCAYLEHHCCPLDEPLLEEFKAALYKGWALHCGVGLASAWWRGGADARAALLVLHEDLTSGV